jgi:hypothetical protein
LTLALHLSTTKYADDCNIYVRSHRAGERVMASVSRTKGKATACLKIVGFNPKPFFTRDLSPAAVGGRCATGAVDPEQMFAQGTKNDSSAPNVGVRVPRLASRLQTKRRRSDVRSAATPLRRGRRMMVWQTRVLMDDGH